MARIPDQPAGLPDPASWTRREQPATDAELAAWRRIVRWGGASMAVMFVLAILAVMAAGGTAAIALSSGVPRQDPERVMLLVLLAGAVGTVAVLLVQRVRRGTSPPPLPQVRVIDLHLRDVRAVHVTDLDKFEGYLFVMDAKESVFLHSPCTWLAPDDDDDSRQVVPTAVRFVIAVANGYEPCLLHREDSGPLRRIPDGDDALLDEVWATMETRKGSNDVWLLPTPPSLVASWPRSRPASSPA